VKLKSLVAPSGVVVAATLLVLAGVAVTDSVSVELAGTGSGRFRKICPETGSILLMKVELEDQLSFHALSAVIVGATKDEVNDVGA
jgi:hypothetical protein